MRVTFFGTAGAVQGRDNANTSFLVAAETGRTVLVDASGDPVQSMLRAGTSPCEVDAVFLTHAHTDHIYALPSLFHNMRILGRTKPLTLAGNPPTLDFARSLLGLFGHLDRRDTPPLTWQTVGEGGGTIDLAGFTVSFFPTTHAVPCHGCVLREDSAVLVYGADGGPNPHLNGLNLGGAGPTVIHEASGLHGGAAALNADGHSSGRQAGEAARALAASRLFLCGLRTEVPEETETLRREAEEAAGRPTLIPVVGQPYRI